MVTEKRKFYRQNHKEQYKQYDKKYRQSHKEKIKQRNKKYYQEHKEQHKQYSKMYNQTENGHLVNKKRNAKRKRSLGFIPLMNNPFPDEIPIEHHHINNIFVIPVPRQVHRSMYGKNHRIKVNDWIEQYIGLVGI